MRAKLTQANVAARKSFAAGTWDAREDTAVANLVGLVGRTVAEVERDLILETLRHCFGNRTRAATVLGISIRTLRNKLNDYAADGVAVPRPGAEPNETNSELRIAS